MSARYASYTRLRITTPAERVLKIELNRPERLNATDEAMQRSGAPRCKLEAGARPRL